MISTTYRTRGFLEDPSNILRRLSVLSHQARRYEVVLDSLLLTLWEHLASSIFDGVVLRDLDLTLVWYLNFCHDCVVFDLKLNGVISGDRLGYDYDDIFR
jgi:hypothetical protein